MESKQRIPWNKGLKGFKHSGSFKPGHKTCVGKSWKWTEESKENVKGKYKGIRRSIKTEIKPGQRIGIKTEFKKGQIPLNKFVDEHEVIKLYNNGLKTIEISRLLNCSQATIYRILKKENIKLRPLPTGENHPAWKGGKFNRENWIIFFHTLLTNKYNYKYKNGKIEVKICSS